ncbi:hypothetical protein RvY_05534 [Ramazzottius varieornatus]|uniref:Uncharacterized protein n=1 Tax=Ramazzottius varieornatus TaxID=947166 RepID=A0A1D1UVD5_RAMVA|nr:hypothetical protein RvY_05534 [Ramazzottius varieornatus]
MDPSDDELPLPEPGLQRRTLASRLDVWEHFERGEGKLQENESSLRDVQVLRKGQRQSPEATWRTVLPCQARARMFSCTAACQNLIKLWTLNNLRPGKEQLKARLKPPTTQGSLMGFVDRPLTTSEKCQFETLLASAFLDFKDRISRAVSNIDTVFSRQPTVTLTFVSFKNVYKNKLLGSVAVIRTGNGTENHIFGENITDVSYTGD